MGVPGGWPVQFAPFLILAATAAALHASWQRIPERFPVHWGIDGQPNGWSGRTAAGVYGPLLLGVAFVALLAFAVAGCDAETLNRFRVERGMPPLPGGEGGQPPSTSVTLGSERLGLIAKVDLIESDGGIQQPTLDLGMPDLEPSSD